MKNCIDVMAMKLSEKYPDVSLLNPYFELVQQMLDQGMEKKDIKSNLKTLYGVTEEEMDAIEEKMFKKAGVESLEESMKEKAKSLGILHSEFMDMLSYLDDLRDSGVTNMFGSPSYLAQEFDLDAKKARDVVSYWMKTFSDRHKKAGTGNASYRQNSVKDVQSAVTNLNAETIWNKATKKQRTIWLYNLGADKELSVDEYESFPTRFQNDIDDLFHDLNLLKYGKVGGSMKSNTEIMEAMDKIRDGKDFPGMSYKEGVEVALQWVLGEVPDEDFFE